MVRIFKRLKELLDIPAPEPGKALGWDGDGNPANLSVSSQVTSINTLTGDVVLDATAVNAIPDTGNNDYVAAIDQDLATTIIPTFPGLKLGTASYDTAVITQQSGGGLSFTSPPNDPQVNGISYIFNAKSWNDNSAGKALQIQRSSTPLVTVNGNGNVGIGTTNPQTKLDVNGEIGAKGIQSYEVSLEINSLGNNVLIGKNNSVNLGLGTDVFGTAATKTLAIGNGTSPTTSPADSVQLYSADISGPGTAGLHIRPEDGSIVKVGNGGVAMKCDDNGNYYLIKIALDPDTGNPTLSYTEM